jgi:hypothetical protein
MATRSSVPQLDLPTPDPAQRRSGPPPVTGPRDRWPAPDPGQRFSRTPLGDDHGPPPVPPGPSATAVGGDGSGPPPPPTELGPTGRARIAAATWVAAFGAVLLLAAAATFLAVQWDALGLTGRVAIVAAATGAAIVGGHRLRQVLPAVGAVVYHLGALLIPIDALGLALQLDLDVAATWMLVGASALVALPPLAVTGRSRTLAWGAVAGIPVLATGVGLASAASPAVLVAAAAFILAAVAGPSIGRTGPGRVLLQAGPVLAVGSVIGSFAAETAGLLAVSGAAIEAVTGAGWMLGGWELILVTTGLSVAALVVAGLRTGSAAVLTLAPITLAFGALTAALGPGVADVVGVRILAFGFLSVEVLALLVARRREVGDAIGAGATAVEALAVVIAGPAVLLLALVPGDVIVGTNPDPGIAWALAVGGLGWLVGAGRRVLGTPWTRPAVVLTLAVAGLHLAAAAGMLVLGSGVMGAVLLATAVAMLPLIGVGQRELAPTWPLASAVATLLALLGLLAGGTSLLAPVLTVAVAVVLGTAAWRIGGSTLEPSGDTTGASPDGVGRRLAGDQDARRVGAGLLRAVAAAAVLAVPFVDGAGAGGPLVTLAVTVGALLVLAAGAEDAPLGGDVLRGVAAVALVLLTVPLVGVSLGTPVGLTTAAQGDVVDLLGIVPGIWWLASLLSAALVVDAVRLARPRIVALAVPVLVQATGALVLALGGDVELVGLVLACLALAGIGTAALAPRAWLPAGIVAGVVAGPASWVLIGPRPLFRASVLIGVGLTVAALGAWRGRALVANAGGALAVIGVWQILDLYDVTAVDLWVLPVAAQLWVAGSVARRKGASSWITDVPPLLLIAIPAIGERLTGGPAWHSLLAGGVAVFAIVVGGARRLGGPLFVGGAVLVVVVAVELLVVVADVPTWVWLAIGGTTLIAVAVGIERAGANPMELGRRAHRTIKARYR